MPLSIYSMCTVLHYEWLWYALRLPSHIGDGAGECEQRYPFVENEMQLWLMLCLPLLHKLQWTLVHFILTSVGFIVTAKMRVFPTRMRTCSRERSSEKKKQCINSIYIIIHMRGSSPSLLSSSFTTILCVWEQTIATIWERCILLSEFNTPMVTIGDIIIIIS